MALQPQVRSFPLFGSLDLKSDVKYVTPGKLLTAQNARSPGVQGTTKRYGQSLLGTEVGIDVGRALGAFRSELLLFDGSSLWAYAPTQDTWVERVAGINEVVTSRSPVIRGAETVQQVASLRTDIAEIYAWQESGGALYYAARDAESGTFLKVPTLLASAGAQPSVFQYGNFVYIGYIDDTGALSLGRMNPFALSSGITFTYPLAGTAGALAVAFCVVGTSLVVAYESAVLFNVVRYSSNIVEQARDTAVIANAYQIAATANAAGTGVLIARTPGAGSTVHLSLFYDLPTSLAKATSTATVTGALSGRVALCEGWLLAVGTQVTSSEQSAVVTFSVTDVAHAIVVAAGGRANGLDLASGGALLDSVPYAIAVSAPLNVDSTTSQQASFYLLRLSDAVVVQRFAATIAAYSTSHAIPTPIDDRLHVALLEQFTLRADATGTVYGAAGITSTYVDLPDTSLTQIVPFGTTAVVSVGNAFTYDGASVVESGFWEFPGSVASSVGAGGAVDDGLHFYQVTYEWTDAAGNIHYSAPSYPLAVTFGGGSNQTTLEIPYTALTRRTGANRDATINVYRTLANTQGPYYWVTSVSNAPAFDAINNRLVSIVDAAADATIASQRQLYAPADFSGEIDNDAPPPFRCVVATKTRVFGIPQDDPYVLWYSKPLNSNRPVEWSAAQVKRIEVDGGLPTALGAIDAQVIVFKQSRIYGLPGQGPAANGLPANGFGELELISTTVGCTSQPSVLNTHEGCFFKSQTGMVALNRGFSIDFGFGVEVQPLVSSLTITGAVSVPAQNQFRWSSSDGTCVVYDYLLKRWSTYANYAAVGFAPFRDTSARLRADGTVAFEDVSVFTDFGSNVALTLETPWFKTADLAQGYAAVWYASLLGTFVDAHNLVIEVAYDYVDVPTQVVAWNPNTVNSLYGSDSPYGATVYYGSNVQLYTAQYQVRLALQRQVCEAIKFKIYDTGGSGQSCTLNEIALQYGVIGGINRVPMTTQQV